MNTFIKFGVFNLLMITGWFQLYGDETAEKLSEIEKQVDAMMERIQQLKSKNPLRKNLQCNPTNPKTITIPNPVSEAPLPGTEESSVEANISTAGGVEQNASLPTSIASEFPIVETFPEPLPCTKSTQSFIPVDRGFMIEKGNPYAGTGWENCFPSPVKWPPSLARIPG